MYSGVSLNYTTRSDCQIIHSISAQILILPEPMNIKGKTHNITVSTNLFVSIK